MKRMYEVEWYECDLTIKRNRVFFSLLGAQLFSWWVVFKHDVKTKIYAYDFTN